MTLFAFISLVLFFVLNEVIVFMMGYTVAINEREYNPYVITEIHRESDICGCGEIVIENGFEKKVIHVGEDNAVLNIVAIGDKVVSRDDGVVTTYMIPINEIGKIRESEVEKSAYADEETT